MAPRRGPAADGSGLKACIPHEWGCLVLTIRPSWNEWFAGVFISLRRLASEPPQTPPARRPVCNGNPARASGVSYFGPR